MSIEMLPGGHCLKCHKDYIYDILYHIDHECLCNDLKPSPCFCDTKYKIYETTRY